MNKDWEDYVYTPALEDAVDILQNKGFVILCGPPGSGKTTLAYALCRRSRAQGFAPYILDQIRHWKFLTGKQGRSTVVLDETFGKAYLDSKQYRDWEKNLDTLLAMIKAGWLRLVITVYPHILHELQQLEKSDSPLKDYSAIAFLNDTLPLYVRERMLNAHLKKLQLDSGTQRQIVETVFQNDESGPVFPWCCNHMVQNWSSSKTLTERTAIFLHPAEAYSLLFNEMVLDKACGVIFVALLVLTMKGVCLFCCTHSNAKRTLHNLRMAEIDDHTLRRYALNLHGSILFCGAFHSRTLYEAAGLALGRFFSVPILLKVCDIRFLVKYVKLKLTLSGSQTFVTVGEDSKYFVDHNCSTAARQALVERICAEIIKGNLSAIFQHPSLQCPVFLWELDGYCAKNLKRMKELLNAKDVVHQQSLVYWSAVLPSPVLTQWCRAKELREMCTVALMTCSSFENATQTHYCRLQPFLSDMLTDQFFLHQSCIMYFPFPNHCLTREVQMQIDVLHETTQGKLMYLIDPSLPIPTDLVTVQVTQNTLRLEVKDRRHWYLVFRLLTDRTVMEEDKNGDTVLHLAVNNGLTNVARLCLKAGAVITQKNRKGMTPYQLANKTRALAAKNRQQGETDQIFTQLPEADLAEVQLLLLEKISVNDKDGDGRTGLLLACREGKGNIADLFIELGADVNAMDIAECAIYHASHGNVCGLYCTPIAYAAYNGMENTVQLLIRRQATLNTQQTSTALHFACMSLKDTVSTGITDQLLRAGADVNDVDERGNTPLMWASKCGRTDTAELLINYGADVNAQNSNGLSSLMWAAMDGNTNTVKLLMENGAVVSALDKDGHSSLMWSVECGKTDTVELLINHGADINAQTNDGQSLVMLAAVAGLTDTTKLLLQHGGDVNAQNEDGQSLLILAAMNGNTDTAKVLLEYGADVNALDKDGRSSLMWAAMNGNTDTAKLIIYHGADINARDNRGQSSLMHAVIKGRTEAAELLINHGADIIARDKDGQSSLMLAAKCGRPSTEELLINHGAGVNALNRMQCYII